MSSGKMEIGIIELQNLASQIIRLVHTFLPGDDIEYAIMLSAVLPVFMVAKSMK